MVFFFFFVAKIKKNLVGKTQLPPMGPTLLVGQVRLDWAVKCRLLESIKNGWKNVRFCT